MNENNEPKSLKVWDPVVRIGHWLIVIGVLTAYFSGDEAQTIHVTAGYVVAGVVVFRILWGFVGTRHARFTDFVRGPAEVFNYLKSLFTGKAQKFTGHNPAGGAMVIALLLSLLITTGSGMALLAVEENQGPLAPFMTAEASIPQKQVAFVPLLLHQIDYNEDDEDEEDHGYGENHGNEEMIEGIHKTFTYLTLFLAGLHILGVFISSRAHGENLTKAMITGRKTTRPE